MEVSALFSNTWGLFCLTRCAVSGNSQTKKNRPQLFDDNCS